jgi:protein ImuB
VPADRPLALIEKVRGALRLAALDAEAVALGLAGGMTLADARARVPELIVEDYDGSADRRWLERMTALCDRYTPLVALKPPDGLIFDITGCEHLFGDENGLVADARHRLSAYVSLIRSAVADSPEAAFALARFSPEGADQQALHDLPVEALEQDKEVLTALRRAGLRTIGDLAARPTAPLTARFGAGLTDALDRLLGRADSRLTPLRAAPDLFFAQRFAEPIGHNEQALDAVAELTRQAAEALRERHSGGRGFAVRFYRSDGAMYDLLIETGQPTRDPALITRLFREKIDHAADPLDPGFGFDMIRLAVPIADPLAPMQLGLHDKAVDEEAFAALINRLSIRLGRGRIRRLAPRDTHIPEQQVLALTAIDAIAPAPWPQPIPGEPPLRPLCLFEPPQPIEVMAEVPDGPPYRFRWRRQMHEVRRYEGPERIAAEWWRRKAGAGLTRDYYRVEDARGRRFWLFRHGLYGNEREHPAWYMHGLFA